MNQLIKNNKIIFKDLSNLQKYFQTLNGLHTGSAYFSSNLFSQVIHQIKYKSLLFGYQTNNRNSTLIKTVNPSYTSQMCPFSVAKNNIILSDINIRKTNIHTNCVTGIEKNHKFSAHKKGKLFLHTSTSDPHHPKRPVLIDRDFVGAFNLTYC